MPVVLHLRVGLGPLTLPLADVQLQALKGVVIWGGSWFRLRVVELRQVRVREALCSCHPGLRVQQQHGLQNVHRWRGEWRWCLFVCRGMGGLENYRRLSFI